MSKVIAPVSQSEEAAAGMREEVTCLIAIFGNHLKNVSLLSPTVAADLQTQYAPFITAQLLEKWKANPQTAPGRLVSSPWPDTIAIDEVLPTTNGYLVSGRIVSMTSANILGGGNAGEVPVKISVISINGQLFISDYVEHPVTTQSASQGVTGVTIEAQINKGGSAGGVVIVPTQLIEDSRCPTGTQCVQAGTVRVKATVTSAALKKKL